MTRAPKHRKPYSLRELGQIYVTERDRDAQYALARLLGRKMGAIEYIHAWVYHRATLETDKSKNRIVRQLEAVERLLGEELRGTLTADDVEAGRWPRELKDLGPEV